MSNSWSDRNNRPTLTRVEAQPDTDTGDSWLCHVAWGSPYGATVHGYDELHATYTRLKQLVRSPLTTESKRGISSSFQPIGENRDDAGTGLNAARMILIALAFLALVLS